MGKRLELTGQIQGVGFRPFVYRLATSLNLSGWVQNTASGVTIEIHGEKTDEFIARLQNELPPLAHIATLKIDDLLYGNSICTESVAPVRPEEARSAVSKGSIPKFVHPSRRDFVAPQDERSAERFIIKPSETTQAQTQIPADTAICQYCITELFDPGSRYYLYPFISCTDCGARYSLIKKMPYDRINTSINPFKRCEPCETAYQTPNNRRFHAEISTCPQCGITLNHSLEEVTKHIQAGNIIALKSLGGYQLICDANNETAIKKLRHFKRRNQKPFATMMLNDNSIKAIAEVNNSESQALNSAQRPIALLNTSDANTVGVMLPYTGLHYLLFYYLLNQPKDNSWLTQQNDIQLIVTSANRKDEPLIIDDDIAKKQLNTIADLIFTHNYQIIHRVDDSVIKIINNKPSYIRRARGYAPKPITLPKAIPSVLALGGYLKNTICITKENQAYFSPHIGDLNTPAILRAYKKTIRDMLNVLNIQPEIIALDYQPDYYANEIASHFQLPIRRIQHHHAHLAACAIEQKNLNNTLGLVLDGFGLSEHHEGWGGELFEYQHHQFKHLGQLKPIMQPGGDIAAREPWRMAASILFELGKTQNIQPEINEMLMKQINSPYTSSCGRLFDAASALLGICQVNEYEGQAAMLLEQHVRHTYPIKNTWKINNQQLNLLPLFEQMLDCGKIQGAELFHSGLIAALTDWIMQNAALCDATQVLLSGGCFQNKILTEGLCVSLEAIGIKALTHTESPVNDAGISLGQAWIAGCRSL